MNRVKIILKENRTLHEMLIGLVLSNLVILLIGLIVTSDRLQALLGVLIGFWVAVLYTVHMAVTLDDALCLDEKGAASQLRKHMLIRYGFVCVIIAVVSYFGIGNPVLCIISVLTVKLGAYLQPIVHKLFTRFQNEESESGGEISE